MELIFTCQSILNANTFSTKSKPIGQYKKGVIYVCKKLMNVSNSATHVFMDIKIVNSEGGVVKKDSFGAYVEVE